jgi:hypothetical protein
VWLKSEAHEAWALSWPVEGKTGRGTGNLYEGTDFRQIGKMLGVALNQWVPGSFFFFSILGFELKAYTLSHSPSPFLYDGFFF